MRKLYPFTFCNKNLIGSVASRCLLTVVLSAVFFLGSSGQQTKNFDKPTQSTKPPDIFFLQKSKQQKRAANITVISGVVLFVPGVILLGNQIVENSINAKNSKTGLLLTAAGIGCFTATIVLISASSRNKKKAYSDISFQINKPILINTGFQKKYLPYSIGVNIKV